MHDATLPSTKAQIFDQLYLISCAVKKRGGKAARREERKLQVTTSCQSVSQAVKCDMVNALAHCATAPPPFGRHCWRQEGAGDSAACASLSAPESLTRGHESTTSQVRVSGMEKDAYPKRTPLPRCTAALNPLGNHSYSCAGITSVCWTCL